MRITPETTADEIRDILASLQDGGSPSRQVIAARLEKLGAVLTQANVRTAMDDAYQQTEDILDKELTKLKKHGWWAPGKNYVVNWAIMGINTWRFSILPPRADKTAYRPEEDPYPGRPEYFKPEGLVIRPMWIPAGDRDPSKGRTLDANPKVAQILADYAKQQREVKDTVASELKWVESKFGIDIPSKIQSKLISDAEQVAKRRWGVDRLRVKNTLVPFDGSKPIPLSTFG